MKAGKVSESILKRSVLKQLHKVISKEAFAPKVGQDYGSFGQTMGELCFAESTMPFCYEGSVAATIYRACNNLWCAPAVPKGILVNVLVPTTSNEQELRTLMAQVADVCEKENLLVLGGHTEVVRTVTQMTLCITAIGERCENVYWNCNRVKPGMDLVVLNWIGLEGTSILAKTKEETLASYYAVPFIENAKRFEQYLSIQSMAAVATMSGVVAMHDLSEGGIYGALWEMAQCAGVGLEIDLKKIPIRQETVEICEFFDLNPYKILSGGCLLVAAEDGNSIVMELEKTGIPAVVIGKATDSNDRVLINEEERRFLETTQTDELYHL